IVFSGSTLAVTVGYAIQWLPAPVFAHLVLSYPTGRLRPRLDRIVVSIAYAFAAVSGLVAGLFFAPRPRYDFTILMFEDHAVPVTHLSWFDPNGVLHVLDLVLFALALLFLG